MNLAALTILTMTALLGALAQLLLKKGALACRNNGRFIASLAKPATLAGITLIGVNLFLLAYMMRSLPLTLVMPVSSLVYVFVPLLSRIFLKEKVTPRFWAGVVCIVAGVSCIAFP